MVGIILWLWNFQQRNENFVGGAFLVSLFKWLLGENSFLNNVSFCGVEDGQYKSKRVVVHCIVIKYASCDTVVFEYLPLTKFHTHTTGMTQFLDNTQA